MIERFRDAARKLIAAGAEAIIPGEAPLNVLLAANGVTQVDGAPIIDSLGAWVRDAEKLVDQRRLGGKPNRRGYFNALVDRERRDEILRFYGLN